MSTWDFFVFFFFSLLYSFYFNHRVSETLSTPFRGVLENVFALFFFNAQCFFFNSRLSTIHFAPCKGILKIQNANFGVFELPLYCPFTCCSLVHRRSWTPLSHGLGWSTMCTSPPLTMPPSHPSLVGMGLCSLKTSWLKWSPDYDGAAHALDKAGGWEFKDCASVWGPWVT